jgi:hypothetical protein
MDRVTVLFFINLISPTQTFAQQNESSLGDAIVSKMPVVGFCAGLAITLSGGLIQLSSYQQSLKQTEARQNIRSIETNAATKSIEKPTQLLGLGVSSLGVATMIMSYSLRKKSESEAHK